MSESIPGSDGSAPASNLPWAIAPTGGHAGVYGDIFVKEVSQLRTDSYAHFLRIFRTCNFAGSKSPYRFIGDNEPGGPFGGEAFDCAAQLSGRGPRP
ncbi:hypothetical protein ABIB17_003008 [Arthrobacter sp. UYEF6]